MKHPGSDQNNEKTPLISGPPGKRVRTLSRMMLVSIMYFSVAGGPEVRFIIPCQLLCTKILSIFLLPPLIRKYT